MSADPELATYCCDLLGSLGPCRARRMFGGYGISCDGLTVAMLADLGAGEILWLKADEQNLAQFEAVGCQRFTYEAKGQAKTINYYSAPAEAMESPGLMAPWARLAWDAALRAHVKAQAKANAKPKAKPKTQAAAPTKARPKAAKTSAKRG